MAVEHFDLGRRKRLALALGLFTGQVCVLGPPDDQRWAVERAQRGGGPGSTGDRTPRTETSTVVMLTSDPSSVIVFGRRWPGGHSLVVRMPGQAFSPDVLGGERAHLA